MKIELCTTRDKNQRYYIDCAKRAGYEVTTFKGRWWAEVLVEEYNPPEFAPIEDGLYIFEKEKKDEE